MIDNVVRDWYAKGCPTTPESVAHAKAIVDGAAWSTFSRNFTGQKDKPRKPVTLSSNFYCARHIAYDHIAYDMIGGWDQEEFTIETRSKFLFGDVVETLYCAKLALAFGWQPDYELLHPQFDGDQPRVFTTWAGDELGGRPDVVFRFRDKKYIADIKSMNDMSFGFAVRGKDRPAGVVGAGAYYSDKFGRRTQLANYMTAGGFDGAFFVGVSKGDGKTFEDEITRVEAEALTKNAHASYVHAKATLPEIPNRPPWATEKLIKGAKPWKGEISHTRCSYCKRRPVCWPDHELAPLKGQVKYRRNLSDEEAQGFTEGK